MTILVRGDLVACPYCQANQGVAVNLYRLLSARQKPATVTYHDECIECEEVFLVEDRRDGTYEVQKRSQDGQ